MDILLLQAGEHRGADFNKLLAAVVRYNSGIGKAHKIRQRNPHCIYIGCRRGEGCSFRVNAVLLADGTGLRVTKLVHHNCVCGSVRKRQLKTAVISTLTDTADRFVVARGRRGGNSAQLQQMIKKDVGFDLKPHQVHNIIHAKIGGVEHHMAHFRIIHQYMAAVADADPECRYTVEVSPMIDGQTQFRRLFCCPSGSSRTFPNFDGMVSVDATHLKSVVQGQLFTMTAYYANRAVTILAFGVAGSEDGETWNWFLGKCLQCFPSLTILMSDGAKGVESHAVQAYLNSANVRRSRCAWHIIRKNLKTAKVRYNDDEVKQLWLVVRSRTRERADLLLSDLSERNSELGAWFSSRAELCCAYNFLDLGLRRLGVCTSNTSEQSNSFLIAAREMPICDIVAHLIGEMCDDRFRRGRKAVELMNNGEKLTPRALSAYSAVVHRSDTLLCQPEEVAADGSFTCAVRRSADKPSYKVRVTPSYTVECQCRHFEEMLRPCDHAVAAIKAASTLVGLPHYQDVMNYPRCCLASPNLERTARRRHKASVIGRSCQPTAA